jgi:hypothetical protein
LHAQSSRRYNEITVAPWEPAMKSPFPGMDPFIENQEWTDFHHALIEMISELLVPEIEPRYLVRVERRVYVEHGATEEADFVARVPDVVVADAGSAANEQRAPAVVTLEPVKCILPMPVTRRESYLVIRDRENRDVVTVIEVLSPANKRAKSDGRREYLEKRDDVLQSQSHLVEIDLLRGGELLPVRSQLPPADYHVIVSRRHDRPHADVFTWSLRDPLPTIPVPLLPGDGEAPLNLAEGFAAVFQRKRYDLSLNYRAELSPPPTANDARWISRLLTDTDQTSLTPDT